MGTRSVITLTTGRAGAGKSFVRCASYLVDDLLPETDAHVWTNFPIGLVPEKHQYPPAYPGERFIDRIAEAVAAKTGGTVSEYLERLHVIPEDEIERWREGDSGPWEFFKDKDLGNCHIALDEIHVFCGSDSKPATKHAWKKWLGEIRHRGASVELISQHRDKIAKELVKEAGTQLALIKIDDTRDPFCGILLGDWYELRAKFLTGEYTSTVVEIEKMDQDGQVVETNRRQFKLTGDYFRFYDSFSAPMSGSGSGAAKPQRQFERRGRCSLLLWFFVRNSPQLGWRVGVLSLLVWLAIGGGGAWAARKFDDGVRWMADRQKAMAWKRKGETPAPSPAPALGMAPAGPAERDPRDNTEAALLQKALAAKVELEGVVAKFEAREAELGEMVLVTETEIVTRGGEVYGIGAEIETGQHKGARLVGIDFRRRVARLSNGEVLRMRGGMGGTTDGLPDLPGHQTTPDVVGTASRPDDGRSLRPTVGGTYPAGTTRQ